ncbi:MAG TPA: DinB family protein [Chloroflexota bacterium]|nr:DinB family protein [Chloroflexota bacterium]
MPAFAPPTTDEKALLLAYLDLQRQGLRNAAYGLKDEQARRAPTVSALSIGGLIKHVTGVEEFWMNIAMLRELPDFSSGSPEAYEATFRMGLDETLADTIGRYNEVKAATEDAIHGLDDLSRAVPVPRGVPWFPTDVEAWSVRWVLLHLIQETCRHAGHADIIREAIDGATMYPLMAAVDGWPETPWIKPWKPAE